MQSVPPSPGAASDGACGHCRAPLGRNDLSASPHPWLNVGRRFAYDRAKRRVWVVCRSCRRWSPCATRSADEVVEACEHHYRSATRRRQSEGVQWARHASGVDLIKLDGASAFERAMCRYRSRFGPRFVQRASWWRSRVGEAAEAWLLERTYHLRGALAGTPFLVAGLTLALLARSAVAEACALALVLIAFFRWFTYESDLHETRLRRSSSRAHVAIARVADAGGASFVLHADQAERVRVVRGPEPFPWRLSVPARTVRGCLEPAAHEVVGTEAVRVLRLALADAGRARAGARAIRAALEAIGSAGGASEYLSALPCELERRGLRYAMLDEIPAALRLALEIAADEVYEASMREPDLAVVEREREAAAELAPA